MPGIHKPPYLKLLLPGGIFRTRPEPSAHIFRTLILFFSAKRPSRRNLEDNHNQPHQYPFSQTQRRCAGHGPAPSALPRTLSQRSAFYRLSALIPEMPHSTIIAYPLQAFRPTNIGRASYDRPSKNIPKDFPTPTPLVPMHIPKIVP